jgi:hypothetical protein
MTRLQSGRIVLVGPDQTARFEVDEPDIRFVSVRVDRDPDEVLSIDGRVLGPEEAADVDLDRLRSDFLGRPVHEYRKLEIYRVEAESAARYPFGAVRVMAVMARLDTGQVVCIGTRYDRGYFR